MSLEKILKEKITALTKIHKKLVSGQISENEANHLISEQAVYIPCEASTPKQSESNENQELEESFEKNFTKDAFE